MLQQKRFWSRDYNERFPGSVYLGSEFSEIHKIGVDYWLVQTGDGILGCNFSATYHIGPEEWDYGSMAFNLLKLVDNEHLPKESLLTYFVKNHDELSERIMG
jgi:hypothetical protein